MLEGHLGERWLAIEEEVAVTSTWARLQASSLLAIGRVGPCVRHNGCYIMELKKIVQRAFDVLHV